MTAFDDALKLVLTEEGGKVDDPRDHGGRTNKGITQRAYDAWRASKGLLRRDVYLITDAEVEAIYRNAYADHVRFDDLPSGVGYAVFDDAVNSGTVEGAKELQRAVGMAADGVIGDLTLAAVRRIAPVVLVGRLCDGRLTFLRLIKGWITFGKGWSNRVEFVRTHALAMARAPSPPKVDIKVNTATAPVVAHAVPSTPVVSHEAPIVIDKPVATLCPLPTCPLRAANPVREMLR